MQTRGSTELLFKNLLYDVSQGKSLAIVTKMIDFRRWHPAQAYTMFASEKVSERNENCRFQPAYVRKAIARKVVRSERLGGISLFPHLGNTIPTTPIRVPAYSGPELERADCSGGTLIKKIGTESSTGSGTINWQPPH
jgi:hypothetical protein